MPNRERVEAFIASVVCGDHIRAIADYCGGEIRLRRCVGMDGRRDSLAGTRDARTRKVANALASLAPAHLECNKLEIGDLPLYSEDLEENAPASWKRFRSDIKSHDAVLFLTPEYNRSVPGCLKNALDVGSRPEGKNHWDGLPAGVVSVTPYKLGAFGANHALRQTFVYLNLPVMQQPEAYICGAGDLFDASDALKSPETRAFFAQYMTAFAHWIETIKRGSKRTHFDNTAAA